MPYVIGEVEVTNDISLAPNAVLYDGAVVADGDLSIKVNGFNYELAGLFGKYPGSVGNPVPDNTTSYVYLDGLGVLWISTAGYPSGVHIRLARVVTQGGFIVRTIMERALLTAGGSLVSNGAKAGIITPGFFGGSPKSAHVAFTTPYPDANYSVVFSVVTDGTKTFSPSTVNKTATGFDINLNTNNVANLIEVGWHTMPVGG